MRLNVNTGVSNDMEYIKPYNGNDKLIKEKVITNSIFGKYEKPIFKTLSELDMNDYMGYKDTNKLYLYFPIRSDADNNGVVELTIMGYTTIKRDNRSLIIAYDKNFGNCLFEYKDGIMLDCGLLKSETNWKAVNTGDTYKGYYGKLWIKGDIKEALQYGGKVYELIINL